MPQPRQAPELADQLEEGYGVVRLSLRDRRDGHTRRGPGSSPQRLHGEVEPGGELVWEVAPGNPFAIFGGLGGGGTPL